MGYFSGCFRVVLGSCLVLLGSFVVGLGSCLGSPRVTFRLLTMCLVSLINLLIEYVE